MNFIELTDYFTNEKTFINMSHVSEFKKCDISEFNGRQGTGTELIYPFIDDEEDETMRFTLHVKEEPEEIVKLINKGK